MSTPGTEPIKICASCGRSIPMSSVVCPYCGIKQPPVAQPAQSAPQGAPPPQQAVIQPQTYVPVSQPMMYPTRTCLGCGLQIPLNYNMCPHCGRTVGMGYAPTTRYAMIGGVLNLIASIFGLIMWGFLAVAGGMMMPISMGITGILVVCGAIGAVFSLIGLLGSIMAIQKKMFALAVLGAILGLLANWIFFIIGSVLSLIALIFIIIGKEEFQR